MTLLTSEYVARTYDAWAKVSESLADLWGRYVSIVGFTPYGPQSFTKSTKHYLVEWVEIEETLGGKDNKVIFHLYENWGDGGTATGEILLSELLNEDDWQLIAHKQEVEREKAKEKVRAERERLDRAQYEHLRAKFEGEQS